MWCLLFIYILSRLLIVIKSEFAKLSDLAISQGVSHSELIAEIQQTIIAEYRKRYPGSPLGIAVMVDESTGLVKIFSGKDDITPDEFSLEANQIARQTIIEKLTSQPHLSMPREKSHLGEIFSKLFFWGYNIYLFLFNVFFALSFFLNGENIFSSLKDLGLAKILIFSGLFLLPVFAIIFVVRQKIKQSGSALMQLFFFFEVPLALFSYLSLGLLGKTSFFISLTLFLLLALPFILYLNISQTKINLISRQIITFIGQLTAVFSTYYLLLYSIFIPPLVVYLIRAIFDDHFHPYRSSYNSYGNYPGNFFSFGLGFLLIAIVIFLPLIPYYLTLSLWKFVIKSRTLLIEGLSEKTFERFNIISWSLVIFLIFISILRWSDNPLLKKLTNFPANDTSYEIQEKAAAPLVKEEEKLKKLVTQKLNSRSYYLFSEDEGIIKEIYDDAFENEAFASAMDKFFLVAAYPLVYKEGQLGENSLSQNFVHVFGYPYYQKEGTKSVENKNQDVLLTYRLTKIIPEDDGLFALITIEEEFENRTNIQKEVVYEFNLPSEATINDLKLGPNLEFPGIIAPKGAAQKTYERELQRSRDPALLEQTGPNQYRLRIFPIPAKNDYITLKGKRQKVSFSYVVSQNEGSYALPVYSKKSNIISDASTVFRLENNGQTISQKGDETKIDVSKNIKKDLCQSQLSQKNLDSLGNQIKLIYHADDEQLKNIACEQFKNSLPLLKNYRTAIIYDTSLNNKNNKTLTELKKIIDQSNSDWLNNSVVDLYKLNDLLSETIRLDSDNYQDQLSPVYFSKIADFAKLGKISEKYDLVLIVSGQDISFNQLTNFPFSSSTSVYWIGENKIPSLNLEMTSGIWQGGGGSALSFEEAIQSFLLSKTAKEKYGDGALTLSKYWSLQYSSSQSILPDSVFTPQSAFAAIANKGLQMKFAQNQNREITGDISIMDQLNLMSEKSNIVSPYSSLIALVNEQQIDRLKDNINNYDRYRDTDIITNNPRPIIDQPLFELSPSSQFKIGSRGMMSLSPSIDINTYGGGQGEWSALSNLSFSNIIPTIAFIIPSFIIIAIGFVFYLITVVRKKK